MRVLYLSVVALLPLVSSATAEQQPPSLGEVAAREEDRRKSITEPSRVYTAADVARFDRERPATPLSSCESEEKYDSQSGNHFTILRCPDGTTTEHGSNMQTGTRWQNKYFPDGSQEGIDGCGSRWTYDAATTVYLNENGERRVGEGDFRKRSPSLVSCKPDEPKKDEAYWRQRIEAEREAFLRAQIFAEALQIRINMLSADFVNVDDPAKRNVVAADRLKAIVELDRVNQEIQEHRQAIYAIQEEGRRAGALPGWLR